MKECLSCKRSLDDGHRICPDDGAPLEIVFVGSSILDEKYHLLRRIGGGGMGRVYKARHLGLKRLVSVKILRPRFQTDSGFIERFEREAETLGRLRHPNVVEVTDFGVEAKRHIPYLVMEYLEGCSLAERLRSGALSLSAALPIFDQVADALEHAHKAGILHRDLKPSNVFLSPQPDSDSQTTSLDRVTVLDFGLAQFFSDPDQTPDVVGTATGIENHARLEYRASLEDDVTLDRFPNLASDRSTALLGTPGYMSPEVLSNQPPTPASDVYAFGVLIYRCLAGCPPFQGSAAELIALHRDQEVLAPSVLAPTLPSELDRPILAALTKDPRRRPTSARQVVADLRQAVRQTRHNRWWQQESTRRLTLAAALGIAAILLTTAFEGPLGRLEDRLVDVRFYLAEPRSPTQPLLLVLLDEATLNDDPTPLADRGQEAGELLKQTMAAGAAGIAIDLLLPEQWSRTSAFSDFVLRHADKIALAAFSPDEGSVTGPEAIQGLTTAALGPQRTNELFGFVNLDQDADGVVRRARVSYRDIEGQRRLSFAARAANILRTEVPAENAFRIDYSLDWRQLDQISWHDLAATLQQQPERFAGRLVLVGAVYPGADGPYRVPHPKSLDGEVPGPILQALTLHTLLDKTLLDKTLLDKTLLDQEFYPTLASAPLRPTATGGTLAAAGMLATLGTAVLLLGRRLMLAGSVGIAVAAAWLAGAIALFSRDYLLLPAAPFLAALLTTLSLAFVLRLRLSRFPE